MTSYYKSAGCLTQCHIGTQAIATSHYKHQLSDTAEAVLSRDTSYWACRAHKPQSFLQQAVWVVHSCRAITLHQYTHQSNHPRYLIGWHFARFCLQRQLLRGARECPTATCQGRGTVCVPVHLQGLRITPHKALDSMNGRVDM